MTHRDYHVAHIPAVRPTQFINKLSFFFRPALLALAIAGLLTFSAKAATIFGNTSDADVRSDGLVSASTGSSMLPGVSGTPAMDRSAVYVFQLPDFGAVANPFTTAIFRFEMSSNSGTPANVDLYGLGRRTASTVLASDYYGQTTTADSSDATFLQDNILISSTATGIISTNSNGGTSLKNYLNTQYASGVGAGKFVFLRLSSNGTATSAKRYAVTSANGGAAGAPDNRPQIIYNLPTGFTRPFIWVRDVEKAGILSKITGNAWATSVQSAMIARIAPDVASHQSNRDTYLRGLPVDWTLATPKFKTIPAYSESSVRFPAEAKFNEGVDCAVLYYLTGDAKYARCAADILHNAVKTLLPVAPSTNTGNGGWIFQDDLLKEARVTGNQLPIIYDFLYSWLQSNQVYDVKTATMVNFNFTNAQSVFRTYYELVRDHGQKDSNWSALMATTMLNNLLGLDNATERSTALQIYLTTGTSRQASLEYDYRNFTETGDIWPESLQYSGAVGSIRTTHMVMLERVDPSLLLFDIYPNLPLSLPRISYLRYPNNSEVVSFGDGHRPGGGHPYSEYEMVYQHAQSRGRTDLTAFFGSLINAGVAAGSYDRASLDSYSQLGLQNEPLELLWGAASIPEPSVAPVLPRTDTLPFAGIALQRNPAPSNDSTYGLMCFVGGSAHVHSHASGMSMELFGLGEVMGAKSGTEDYGTTINDNYYRVFASNNTVIVNGASRGEGGWGGFAINTVQTVAMEPQPFANAVSPNFSFTTSSFADDKGTLAEGTQQRTMAIVRTSPTTGYYVDLFRSKSTVANQFHDYIYRNIGETAVDLRANGTTLALTSQPNRFQTDIGDENEQPGWRYFDNTVVSAATSLPVKAQFVATISGTARYMDMHMPAVASREYAKVECPPILEAPSPYNTRAAPALVVRQTGEAWNKAFATVFEPHFDSTGGTVQNVTQLVRSGIVVGVKVESTVIGKNLVQYIISNPGTSETYTDASIGLSFTGRFGIASDNGDGTVALYLGSGSALSYRGNSVATVSGSSSQAEVRFTPGQTPAVTANTAVNVIAAPAPAGGTWVPTAAGAGYNWNSTANWNPATVPSGVGAVARKNINLAGDQTVSVNAATTLGELVVGDSSGSQTTTLQKGTNGTLLFDQTDAGMSYLTRTATGTGSVTLSSDLNLSLNDNLTVRLASGSANSTMIIAGTLAGADRSLHKESSTLTLSLAGTNTYSGATRILGGILSLDHNLALQNSPLDTFNSITGSATGGLRAAVTSLTIGGLTGDKNFASLFTTTSGGYSGVTSLTLNPQTGDAHSYSGVIANGAAGMTLTKTGAGTQTLTGTNTYTGGTTLAASSGTLEIAGAGKLGNGAYAGTIAIGSGSVFKYSSSAAQTLSGAISGAGTITKGTSTSSTLNLSGSNTAFTGSVGINGGTLNLGHASALSGATALSLTGTAELTQTVQNSTVNAPITITNSPTIYAPDFGTGSTVSTLTLNGAISGSGNATFSSTSAVASNSDQTIRLNAQSNYTGTTTLHPAENDANLIVKLGIANALPVSTVLSINGVAGGGSGRFADFELNGFSQTLAGLQNTPASSRAQRVFNSSATAATLTINNAASRTFSGSISGTNLNLIKTGSGTQTLSAANTFGGTTTINVGKLQGVVGGSCVNSSVTLNNAAALLGVSITDNTKTWTCKTFTSSAAGSLEFDFGSIAPGAVRPLTVTGLASFTAKPTVRIIVSNGLAAGTYPLMTWGSTSGTAPTVVSVLKPNGTGGLADGTTASLAVAGNTLNLVLTSIPTVTKANNANNLNLGSSWVGSVAPNLSSTTRWNNTVAAANTTVLGANATWAGMSIINPGGTVTINAGHTLTLGANANDIDMSAATANLTLNCLLVLGDANIWNVATGRTLTIGGVVSGASSLTKAGLGTAVLNGVNTYSGETTISANSGTLEIGSAGRLGSGTYAADMEIGSGSTFRFSSSAAQTLSGVISGSGAFTKSTGTNVLTLSGVNTAYSGSISIGAGTLDLGNVSALGASSAVLISGGATLSTQVNGITINAPITLGAAASNSTISFSRNTAASGSLTLNGLISGAGNLIFTTPGVSSGGNIQTILLTSPNTYSGATTITTGDSNNSFTVKATVANSLPPTTALTLNGGNGAGSGRSVRFDLNGYNHTIAGLTNTTGLSLRSQKVINSNSEPAVLTINNAASFAYSGNLSGAGLSLIKAGAGTQTLSSASDHAGSTSVSAGILSLGNSLALQNSPLETSDSVAGNAANGFKTTVTTLTLGGLIGDKNLASIFTTTSGGYTGVTALTLNPSTGAVCEFSGIVANGAAGMSLTKTGLGAQILAGANSYTGLTNVAAGTLSLMGNRTVLPTANPSIDLGGTGSPLAILNVGGDLPLGATQFRVGVNGPGVANQTAGATSFTGGNQLTVGVSALMPGTYNLSGGTLTTAAATSRGIILGVNTDTTGTFNLSGTGTLNIIAGSSMQIGRSEVVAATGSTGIFNQTGGTASIGELRMGGVSATNNADTAAQLNLSGGTFNAATFTALSGGDTSTSTINISGSADVTLPAFPTARGTSSTATITFDGGTLKSVAASAAYMGGLTNAFIKAGGVTFDTTNGSITISQKLLTDTVSTGGGLTKEGANTLTLTGANTYTGDTTISEGTLSINSATLADTSNITIASGAVLHLAFTGTNTVASLVCNGLTKPAGTYTSANSGGFITGTGSITVLPSFGVFNAANFTPLELADPDISSPTADPDGDGVGNVLEYGFSMDPKTPGIINLPVPQNFLDAGSTYLGCVYTRVKGATDLTFTPQFSNTPDAATFTASGATILSIVDNANGTETVALRDNTPITAGATRFVRLLVIQN